MEIEIDLKDREKAEAILKTLNSDKRDKRAVTNLSINKTWLCLSIQAEDKVALRAAVNTYLRLINSCAEALNL